jgi:hypothetical protein
MNADPTVATVTMSGHRLIVVILLVPWDSTQAMASWASTGSFSSAIVRRRLSLSKVALSRKANRIHARSSKTSRQRQR